MSQKQRDDLGKQIERAILGESEHGVPPSEAPPSLSAAVKAYEMGRAQGFARTLANAVTAGMGGHLQTADGLRFAFDGPWQMTVAAAPPTRRRLTRGQRLVRMVFRKATYS